MRPSSLFWILTRKMFWRSVTHLRTVRWSPFMLNLVFELVPFVPSFSPGRCNWGPAVQPAALGSRWCTSSDVSAQWQTQELGRAGKNLLSSWCALEKTYFLLQRGGSKYNRKTISSMDSDFKIS